MWCAEVVEWRSEWRVHVVDSRTRYVAHYDGDPEANVEDAIERLDRSGEYRAAYAIEFGVLDVDDHDDETVAATALVEINDGFAVGAYGDITAEDYVDVIATRWEELMRTGADNKKEDEDDEGDDGSVHAAAADDDGENPK